MGWRRPNRPPKVAEETLPSTCALSSFAKDERPDHPTPKPLDAFGIPIRQHVARGGLCYEPFSGSGSQVVAGEANGRRVFAMEISPAYFDVAVERWQADTGREAILDGDGRTFPLSLRNVEDLLHERVIDVSHETVRFWWNRFGPIFAAEIRKKRVQHLRACSNWQWHLDDGFARQGMIACPRRYS